MPTNVGEIYYEISADVAPLLQGQRQADSALDSMNQSFEKTNKSSQALDTGLTKLAATIKAVIAASVLRELAGMVQKYQEMSERVQMATASQGEFEMVQARLLKTANGTYRALGEAQELYIRTADSLRSMSYTTSQAIDIQDSMSYAFVKNATAADRADAAISAFSKSVNTGKVAADQWETITSAIPSVINDIATASGKSTAEIRAFGAAGKLTAKELTEGLRQSLDANSAAAAKMSNNLIDAGVRVRTAVTEIAVAFEGKSGALQTFTNGLISAADSMLAFGQDSEKMNSAIQAGTTAAIVFAGVYGSRLVGSLAQSTSAKLTGIATSRQLAAADLQTAKSAEYAATAVVRRSVADKEAAISALNLAQAEYNVARGSAAEAIALDNLTAKKTVARMASLTLAEAETAQAAASSRAAAVARASSLVVSGLKGALSLLGGPVGIVTMVAAGWLLYSQHQAEARKESIAFANTLPDVISKLKEMNLAQIQGVRADTIESIKNQKQSLSELNNEIAEISNRYKDAKVAEEQSTKGTWLNNDAKETAADLEIQLAKKIRDRDSAQRTIKDSGDALRLMNIQINQSVLDQMKAARDNAIALAEAEKKTTMLAGAQGFLAGKLGESTTAIQNFNSESLKINWGGTEGEKLIKQAKRRLELSKLEGKAKAELQATYDAEDAGVKGETEVNILKQVYAQTEANTQGKKDSKKATDAQAAADKKAATQAESIAQKLANLKQESELAATSTQELSREQSMLRAEQSLGSNASADQIKQARDYAAATWDTAAAIKARNAIPELKENADYTAQKSQLEMLKSAKDAQGNLLISQEQYNQQSEQLEQQHQIALAQIKAGQAVTPQQEALGTVDPVQALANEHAKKLALIQAFETQKGVITANGLALMNAANMEYEQQRLDAQWALWKNQSEGNQILAGSFESLAGNASNTLTGIITKSMEAEDALRSIGSNALNSLINGFVQMGVDWVKSAITGAAAQQTAIAATTTAQVAGIGVQTAASTTAAVATTAAWTPAAIMSSIASFGGAVAIGFGAIAGIMALSGKRKNGGPVSAGNMYEFGEGGMFEALQMGGKNYLLPGNNGKVISNKDLMKGADGQPQIRMASTGKQYLQDSASRSSGNQGTQGGAANIIINITNVGTPQEIVDQQTTRGVTGQEVIEIIMADVRNSGPASRALANKMGTKLRPTGE